MKIDVYSCDDPMMLRIAESWTRALRFYGHDAAIAWHPSESRPNADMGFEVGQRFTGMNIGVPFVHYLPDPCEQIPGAWVESFLKGHLFFFADYATSVKAHQQGVRVAEYLPHGCDSLAPQAKIEGPHTHEFFIGHMGIPKPDVLHRLHEVLEYKPDAKIAIWGRKEAWEPTEYIKFWVGEIPDTNTMLDQMNRCRFYLADPTYARPDYFFMQAMLSDKCFAIAPFSGDLWECFEQSRFLYGPAHLRRFFADVNSESTYQDERNSQIKILSHVDGRHMTKPEQAVNCAKYWNRMIDRAFYLFTVLDKKELYINAKNACPPQCVAKFVPAEPRSEIVIQYPDEDKGRFNFNMENIKIEEVPLLLRRAARQVEIMYISGKLEHNTIAKEAV